MQDDDDLNKLINAASARAGSDGKLALMLGVPRQHVSNWRHGHRTCTPENMALLAHIAGLDAIETLARATVRQYEGTAKGDLLMRALGKALLATGAVIGSAGASAQVIFSSTRNNVIDLIRCIEKLNRHKQNRSVIYTTKAPHSVGLFVERFCRA